MLFGGFSIPPAVALGNLLLLVFLRRLLRRTWLAVPVWALVFVAATLPAAPYLPFAVFQSALILVLALRFGLLAMAVVPFAASVGSLALTPDFTAWYAPAAWLGAGFFLAAALWAFRNALGGRKLLHSDFLEG
jgi:hypothetical protein